MKNPQEKNKYQPIPIEIEQAAAKVVHAAYLVHVALGPGLLESMYEECLARELIQQGVEVKRQFALPVVYNETTLDATLRIDLLVNDCLVVEVKAVENLLPVHRAQLLTYLKITGYRLGLLINFNVARIKYGIKRVVL